MCRMERHHAHQVDQRQCLHYQCLPQAQLHDPSCVAQLQPLQRCNAPGVRLWVQNPDETPNLSSGTVHSQQVAHVAQLAGVEAGRVQVAAEDVHLACDCLQALHMPGGFRHRQATGEVCILVGQALRGQALLNPVPRPGACSCRAQHTCSTDTCWQAVHAACCDACRVVPVLPQEASATTVSPGCSSAVACAPAQGQPAWRPSSAAR